MWKSQKICCSFVSDGVEFFKEKAGYGSVARWRCWFNFIIKSQKNGNYNKCRQEKYLPWANLIGSFSPIAAVKVFNSFSVNQITPFWKSHGNILLMPYISILPPNNKSRRATTMIKIVHNYLITGWLETWQRQSSKKWVTSWRGIVENEKEESKQKGQEKVEAM